MKSSRLLVIVLPALLVVLAFVGPFRWLQGSANTTNAEAQTIEDRNAQLERQIRTAKDARSNEDALRTELATIRTILPELPEDVVSPLIRTISDAAISRAVLIDVQDQTESPIATTDDAATTSDVSGNSVVEGQPKAYTVSLEVRGTAGDVIDFIGDLPTSGRVWVYQVSMRSEGEGQGFSTDLNNEAKGGPVTATIELRSYAGPGASATAPPPGS